MLSIKQTKISGLLLLAGLFAAWNASAATGIDTWTGGAGTANWSDAGNWSGVNAPPLLGDTPVFGTVGTGGAILNMNLVTPNTNFLGLTFSAVAPSFVLNGGTITSTGGIVDNSTNLETVNLNLIFDATRSLNAAAGGTLQMGGVISGAGGVTKNGGGTVILTNANTYTGTTAANAGTLKLDFSAAGAPASNIVRNTSVLSLGGGTYSINGAPSVTSAQTNASVTFASGASAITVVSGASGTAYLTLGAITRNNTSTIKINVPSSGAVSTTSGTASTVLVGGNGSAAYAYVTDSSGNVMDFAAKDSGNTFIGAGATQASAQYSSPTGTGNITVNGTFGTAVMDIVNGTGIRLGNNENLTDGIRFNAPGAWFIDTASANRLLTTTAFLVTFNVGPNNVTLSGAGGVRQLTSGGDLIFMQDNTLGEFLMTGGAMATGSSSSATALVKAGRGTMNVSVAQYYTGQTYVNEGTLVINQDGGVGAVGTGAQLNLNGGTLVGNANFTLDNAGANIRAVALGNNGGGLAAAAGFTLTVDGVIGGAAGTGPLTIGIPASTLNGNVAGLVPGTGTGTPNTAINASGTVIINGANTFTGGAVLQSGTVNINGINALGGANYGGLTFNGGTLQYSNTLSSGSDLSISNGITVSAGGGTIDLNGNSVTYANAIGGGGSGVLTVASTAGGGGLTLSGASTYTGNTTISGGKLVLGSSSSLLSKNITVGSGAGLDVSALSYTLAGGKTLAGSGVVTGSVTAASSSTLIPGTLGTAGTLSFSNNLTLSTGETNYFDLSSTTSGLNDRIVVAGTLNLSGTKSVIAINFTGIPSAGRYKLFTYGSKTGTAAANLTTNTFTGSSIGTLTARLDDSVAGEIDLLLTSAHVPTAITWLGDGSLNNWDTTSLNWSSPTSKYFDSDFVTFDDSGSASPAMNLTTALAPGSVKVNAAQNYTFSGPGQLGTGSLTKDNSGTLLVLTTNSLPGPVAILNGTLQLGDGTTSGTIGSGTITNDATFVMDSPTTVATGPVIGTGNTTIATGTLAIGGNSTLNALTLGASGTAGTLDLAGSSLLISALALDPSAAGGTIGNSSTTAAALISYVGGSSTYGGVIQDTLGAGTKAVSLFVNSSGTLQLNSANPFSGGTVINSGTVALGSTAATLGTGAITLTNGSILSLWSGNSGDQGTTSPGNLANALIIPAGHNATIWDAARGTLSSSLTGGGTLDLRVNGVRGDVSGNWNAFNGVVNVTSRTGSSDDFRVAIGGTTDNSYANLKMNLGPGVHMYQSVNPPTGSGTETKHNIGELSGDAASTVGGNPVGGRFADWSVGGLNTSVSYDGSIVDNTGQTRINKVGTGNWILNGASTHSGATWIVGGTLTVNGSFSASPLTNYASGTLAGSGTLFVVDLEAGSTVSPGVGGVGTLACGSDLTFNGGTNVVDIVSGGGNDLITVGGNLNLTAGAVRLVVSGTLPNGTYQLITYGGSLSGGVANLSLSGFAQPGQTARLSDTTPNEIDLVVETPAPKDLVWGGANAADALWNIASSVNWSNAPGPGLTIFNNSDSVTFDDWSPGNTTIDVRAAVQPSAIMVTGAQTYVFGTTTAGRFSGATNSLILKGTATVELDMVNDYGGPTTIGSGNTLTVGNGPISASLGSGLITNNGVLVFNQTNNLALTNIVGTGSLTKNGNGTLTLTGTNAYTGATTIGTGSTLQVGTGGATGGLLGSVTDDGTLLMNQSGNVILNNPISGTGIFTQNGTSVMTMNVANTYQGNTFINHGVLKLGANDVIPDAVSAPGSTGWLILDGNATNAGTLDLNGFNETVNVLQGLSNTVLGDITNSAASGTSTLTFGNDFNTAINGYSGLITENPAGGKIALIKQGISTNILTGANSYSGGTIVKGGALILGNGTAAGSGSITLSNGVVLGLQQLGSSSIFVGNSIITGAGMAATLTNVPTQVGNAFSGLFFSGDTDSSNIIASSISFNSAAVKQFQGFNGTVQVATTGGLRFSASALGTNGGDNTTFDIQGTINTRNGSSAGPGVSLGALTGSGFLTGGANAAGPSTYIIGAKGIDSSFSGTIQDSGNGNVGIVKTGAGKLTLSGTVSYTGNTTVNNGTLALVEPVSLDSSPTLTLGGSAAVLDVSGRADGTLNLGLAKVQALNGIGTITGSLLEAANSSVRVGLGTLTVSTAATFNGGLTVQVNRTNAITHGEVVSPSITVTGPLTVSNIGPALQGGDTFQLFNSAVTGFSATNLPALTGAMYWTNTLAVDGRIAVINPVNTNAPPIQTVVNGTTLTLSWPTNSGWTLQMQTNSLATGLGTNWVDYIPGSTGVTTTNITLDPAKPTVFFRLKL